MWIPIPQELQMWTPLSRELQMCISLAWRLQMSIPIPSSHILVWWKFVIHTLLLILMCSLNETWVQTPSSFLELCSLLQPSQHGGPAFQGVLAPPPPSICLSFVLEPLAYSVSPSSTQNKRKKNLPGLSCCSQWPCIVCHWEPVDWLRVHSPLCWRLCVVSITFPTEIQISEPSCGIWYLVLRCSHLKA